MDEKMPERILAWSWSKGVREHLDLPEIQACIDDGKGNTLGTVYLRSTPVLEHAREMQTRLEKILTILNVVSASGIRTKAEQEIHQIVFDILADIELATIKREESVVIVEDMEGVTDEIMDTIEDCIEREEREVKE